MPSGYSDDQMCEIIDAIRAELGACTLGELGARTGLTRQSLSARVKTLTKRGRVAQSHLAGSIRTTRGRKRS